MDLEKEEKKEWVQRRDQDLGIEEKKKKMLSVLFGW